jgi:hypothetical protein
LVLLRRRGAGCSTITLQFDAEDIGQLVLCEPRVELYGKILHFFVHEILEQSGTTPEILQHVRQGNYSVLFNGDGAFLSH